MRDAWSRRRFLRGLSGMTAGAALHGHLRAAVAKPPSAPFSHFVDVAAEAGLTKTMFYGEGPVATYIIEAMGCGCAFFDYDNDGWMDIFVLGGRG